MFKFFINFFACFGNLYKKITKNPFIILAVFCILITPFHLFFQNPINSFYAINIFIAEICIIVIIALNLHNKNQLNYANIIVLSAVIAISLHAMYILYTPINYRSHDYIDGPLYDFADITKLNLKNFGIQIEGHYGYILYLVNNFPTLPDFDPRSFWQFGHPPLHHLISAVWLKIHSLFFIQYDIEFENIQILTLFYSGCIIILTYKLLKEMYLEKLAFIIPFLIICFHPQLVLLSGSANNDILCFTFSLAAILFAVKWYKEPLAKNMIYLVIFMSAAVMTKLFGFVLLPAIFLLFILKFVKAKNNKHKIIKQIILFCCIFFPLAFFWPLYIHIKYGTPLFLVSGQDFFYKQEQGLLSLCKDMVNIDSTDFQTIFIIDRNISFLIAILKSSIFGEYNYPYTSRVVATAFVLFYSNFILIIVSLFSMFFCILKKNIKLDSSIKIFFSVLYLTIFFAYLRLIVFGDFEFGFKDFRYILFNMVIGSIAIGLSISAIQDKSGFYSNIFKNFITIAVCLFCISSILFWIFVGVDEVNIFQLQLM